MKYQHLAAAVVAASAVISSAAVAQGAGSQPVSGNETDASGIETVTVTAEKRSEDIQKVPITVNAYSSDELKSFSMTRVQDLTTLVSGFTGSGLEDGQSPHMRGIGVSKAEPGQERSVATYVDGVYIGAVSPGVMTLQDASDVEVLKGPQGTLFGRNTTAGLIQLTTRAPDFSNLQVEGEVGYASYNTVSGSAYLNVPLSDDVATNLYVQASHQGVGWGTNLFTGNSGYRDDIDLFLRNRWLVNIGDDTTFALGADYEKSNRIGYYALRPMPGTTDIFGEPNIVTGWDSNLNTDEVDKIHGGGVNGQVTHDFKFATLKNIVAYRDGEFDELQGDADISPVPDLTFDRITHHRQWTEELELSSPSDSPLIWTVGYFYYNAADRTLFPLYYGPAANSTTQQKTTRSVLGTISNAVYGQASYEILPGTTLTGGWRYSVDKHSIDGRVDFIINNLPVPGELHGAPPVDRSFSQPANSARAAISHQLTDNAMVYFSFNHGTKSGGYAPTNLTNPPIADEKLDAYEVGTKLTGLDDTLRLNVAGFYYEYTNIQVNQNINGIGIIFNGAAGLSYGTDIDIEFRPLKNLTLYSSMEFLHSEFTSFPNAIVAVPLPGGGFASSTRDATGARLLRAPTFTGSVGFNYVIPSSNGGWVLAGSYYYNDGYWGDLATQQPSYSYLNASVQYTTPDDRYYVRLWGANLLNAEVSDSIGVTIPFAQFEDLNAPRTFGVTLGARFD